MSVTPKKGFEGESDPEPITQWVGGRGKVGLPLTFGVRLLEEHGIEAEENLSKGTKLICPKRPDPNHPSAPQGQGKFFNDIVEAMRSQYGVLAEAATGSGKTVAALNAVATLGRSAVVIVPRSRLMYQWANEAKKHIGLTDDQIGLVGDGHEQLDRPFTVVVIHNLYLSIYPKEFYESFGISIFDECHGLGAREFNKATRLFPSIFRLALSATPDRKDGCTKLFTDVFGEVSVRSEQEALPLTYEIVRFKLTKILGSLNFCKSTARPLIWLSEHKERNQLIAHLVKELYAKASRSGEAVVVLTSYIEHARTLYDLCGEGTDGIPREEMGFFMGKRIDDSGKRVTIKKAELDHVSANATVIFATYGMMREGIDVPRIGFGIEALPVADVRQAVGRARRVYKDRKRAYWISIKDVGFSPRSIMAFLYQYTAARLRGLKAVGNVTIKEN